MMGCKGGVAVKKKAAADYKNTHCVIHRQALVSKTLPPSFKKVLDEAVKVVNFVVARAKNTRLFQEFCNEMGSEHEHLLVRWLSRGKVMERLFELRHEVQLFLMTSSSALAENFHNELWLARLAYLADIFSILNKMNLELQGSHVNAFQVEAKVKSLKTKLVFVIRDLARKEFNYLPTLRDFMHENDMQVPAQLADEVKMHCNNLTEKLNSYFPENNDVIFGFRILS